VIGQKALPPTYLFSSIVLMVVLHFCLPVAQIVTYPWNSIGFVPFTLGAVINLIADREFKEQRTTVKPFQESSILLTTGVYKFSRHPMYLGMVFILIGIAVLMRSLSPFMVIPFFAVALEIIFIRVEEEMLEDKFDEAWLGYKKKVRRWI
jgi:protein-S-isoprenylcysteine O-methyltransferase Ste14